MVRVHCPIDGDHKIVRVGVVRVSVVSYACACGMCAWRVGRAWNVSCLCVRVRVVQALQLACGTCVR
jgi:hypothetical protein